MKLIKSIIIGILAIILVGCLIIGVMMADANRTSSISVTPYCDLYIADLRYGDIAVGTDAVKRYEHILPNGPNGKNWTSAIEMVVEVDGKLATFYSQENLETNVETIGNLKLCKANGL